MALNKGKQFEEIFKIQWKKCFPNGFFLRLPDQLTGFRVTSQNPCDNIAFTNKRLFLLELKSHEGASIPFSGIPQYERLLRYKDIEDVYPFIIIWFRDKDLVIAVPIKEAEKIYNDGNKSIGVKLLEDKRYNLITIPSVKKKVFMDSDYTILLNYKK